MFLSDGLRPKLLFVFEGHFYLQRFLLNLAIPEFEIEYFQQQPEVQSLFGMDLSLLMEPALFLVGNQCNQI